MKVEQCYHICKSIRGSHDYLMTNVSQGGIRMSECVSQMLYTCMFYERNLAKAFLVVK